MGLYDKYIRPFIRKHIKTCVKYYPFLLFISAIGNIVDLLYGIQISWIYPIFGYSVTYAVLLYFFSTLLRFCVWHRIMIVTILINSILEWFFTNFYIILASDQVEANLVAATIYSSVTSIGILLAVISRFTCNKQCKNRKC